MIELVKSRFLRRTHPTRPEAPIYICCYHKAGTVLLAKVFYKICCKFNWKFTSIKGQCDVVPEDADVIVFQHSLVNLDSITWSYVGAHIIRDPRDVIVSGYLYHKRCSEPWCTQTDFDDRSPILFPSIPFSQEQRPEEWKKQYLASLGNRSYQQNLNGISETDGLLFEMEHYGAWTIESMLDWNYSNPKIEEIKFETLMSDFQNTFEFLFDRFGFTEEQKAYALRIVADENINQMTEDEIKQNPHITSRQTTKWPDYFEETHKEAFKARFGDALIKLGYETSNNW